jgi:hypothetical protein
VAVGATAGAAAAAGGGTGVGDGGDRRWGRDDGQEVGRAPAALAARLADVQPAQTFGSALGPDDLQRDTVLDPDDDRRGTARSVADVQALAIGVRDSDDAADRQLDGLGQHDERNRQRGEGGERPDPAPPKRRPAPTTSQIDRDHRPSAPQLSGGPIVSPRRRQVDMQRFALCPLRAELAARP